MYPQKKYAVALAPLCLVLSAGCVDVEGGGDVALDDYGEGEAPESEDADTFGAPLDLPDDADTDGQEEEETSEWLAGAGAGTSTVASTTRIRGRVTFRPDFKYRQGLNIIDIDGSFPAPGRIPLSSWTRQNVSYLFVCAYEQDGANDFATANYGGDDDLLGCDRADIYGRYLINIERENAGDDVYLVTAYCDNPISDIQIPGGSLFPKSAEVCFSTNMARPANPVGLGSPGGEAERKYTWTRTYWNGMAIGADTKLSWNLSCPNKAGDLAADPELYPRLACTNGELEPTENTYFSSQALAADQTIYNPPILLEDYSANTNSSIGFNKEAVHMFRTGAEVIRRLGTLKPTNGNIAPGADLCTDNSCQNEARLILREAVKDDFVSANPCSLDLDMGTGRNSGDMVCARHRSGANPGVPTLAGTGTTLNPYVIAHELGHIIQGRWENRLGSLGGGGSPPLGSQRGALAEGFANMVAAATWFEPTDPDVNFLQLQIESVSTANTLNWVNGSCGAGNGCGCNQGDMVGEAWETHFFWDLYDPADMGGTDQVQLSFATIRNVWGLFPAGTGDRQKNECSGVSNSDGVNAYDYKFHYDSLNGPSIAALMSLNCMTKHWPGAQCN